MISFDMTDAADIYFYYDYFQWVKNKVGGS
jgi:hypothetical protein